MPRVKTEDNRHTRWAQANYFPTTINSGDSIKEMTDWDARQCDSQTIPPTDGFVPVQNSRWSEPTRGDKQSPGLRSQLRLVEPYGRFYKIMRFDYV